MSTITCLKELNKRKCLELDDIVIFTVKEEIMIYKVKTCWLHSLTNTNYRIFTVLKINKAQISEKTYEYNEPIKFKDKEGYWPEFKDNDYPALTRLVKELYTIIEEREPKYTKYNRFEIMDI